jgi:hypothetical protein
MECTSTSESTPTTIHWNAEHAGIDIPGSEAAESDANVPAAGGSAAANDSTQFNST